ncbi:MAG: hypothetical protein IJS63_09330 [Bacteroidaceae bacterium]|nr:hypothetical protein [Bacteroidaceae bacterium]
MRQFTKEAILHFEREQLLYDIKNYCFIEGDLMERNDEHAKHQTFDVGEEGNIDRVTRVLDVAFASCVELCYPYSKKELKDYTSRDNELEEEDEYVLRLKLPNGFSSTTIDLLEKLIHEYMVYKVVADWMSITKPESKATWQEKIEETAGQIKSSLHGRIGRVRRTLTPF